MEILAIVLGVVLVVYIAYNYVAKPRLNLGNMEAMIFEGEKDRKAVEDAAYWTNKAASVIGVKNTVQEDLDSERKMKASFAKSQKQEAGRVKNVANARAEKLRHRAEIKAEKLRRRAKMKESAGDYTALMHEAGACRALKRIEALDRLDKILNPTK